VRLDAPVPGRLDSTIVSSAISDGADSENEIEHIIRVLIMARIFCEVVFCRSDIL
jgi:hypothetical protein